MLDGPQYRASAVRIAQVMERERREDLAVAEIESLLATRRLKVAA